MYPHLAPGNKLSESPAVGPHSTTTDRQRAEAYQTARLLNRASWITVAWLILYPHPYDLAISAGLLLPVGAALAQWLYPGLLRPDEADASPVPGLGVVLIMPGVGLVVRTMLDGELVAPGALLPWALWTGGGLALVLLVGTRQHLLRKGAGLAQLFLILVAATIYGYGAPVVFNSAYDAAKPVYYTSKVQSKFINDDEFAGFCATVQPWGPFTSTTTVHVSRAHYQKLRIDDRLRIRLMPGRLGLPWFTVVEK